MCRGGMPASKPLTSLSKLTHSVQPLLPTLSKTKTQLASLHDVLAPMATLPPAAAAGSRARSTPSASTSASAGAGAAPGQKAWEMGRQQYLSWAVGKALAAAGQGAGAASQAQGASAQATREARDGPLAPDASLEGVERALKQVGGQEEMDAASRAL
jgi:kinetochore protein Mis12/MTW1